MIEINLLPEELKGKIKTKKAGAAATTDASVRYLLYAIASIFGILILAHVLLFIVYIARSTQLYSLEKKLKELEPQKKELESFSEEYASLSEDARAIKQLTDQRIDWAQKLNQLSLKLPSGIWFTSISISPSSLTLSGSVVSLQKQEMALIKRFMDSLKNDKDFFKDFSSLELSSVKTRTIVTYEVVDFNLIGNLKSKL